MWPKNSACQLTLCVLLSLPFGGMSGCRNSTDSGDHSSSRDGLIAEPITQPEDDLQSPEASEAAAPSAADLGHQPPGWPEQLKRIHAGDSYTLRLETPAEPSLLDALPSLDGKLLELLIEQGGPTDSWFKTIGQLSSLEHLRVRESAITDTGLAYLAAGSENLQILNLPQATITERGIRELAKLPQLKQLRIGGPLIDDEAVIALANLPNLRSLHLIGPSLTGKGLTALAASTKLSSLYIDDCPLPDSAWEELFRAKPQLHVHIDQHHHDRDPNSHSH